MNKIAKMMCLVAILALVGTSCKKKEEAASVKVTFTELDVEEEGGAKSYLVGKRVEWDATDRFAVFNVANGNTDMEFAKYRIQGAGGATVTLTPDGNPGVDPYNQGAFYAFYPYGDARGGFQGAVISDPGHVTATFLLPKVQEYRLVGGVPAIPQNSFAAAAKDTQTPYLGNVHFNMQAICGILHLRYYMAYQEGPKVVDSITIYDKYVHTTGLMRVYIDMINPTELSQWVTEFKSHVNDPYFIASLNAYKKSIGYYIPQPAQNPLLSKTVTLKCPGGVLVGTNSNKPVDFYVSLRPGAAAAGMTIKVYCSDGSVYNAYDDNYNDMIRPNVMKNMLVRPLSHSGSK